jgi:hypothetical protein
VINRNFVAEMYCTVNSIFGMEFSTYGRLFPRERTKIMTQLNIPKWPNGFAFGSSRLDKKGKNGVTAVAVTFEDLPRA